MVTIRILIWAGLTLLAGVEARGQAEERGEADGRGGGAAERIARVFSPEFRRTEERLAVLTRELRGLPELRPRPLASRYGFRSETLSDPNQAQWLQIDLEQRRVIDRILAVPAHIPVLGERGAGYGFPLRFQIEIADDPEMKNSALVVDRTDKDFANPGRYPEDFQIKPTPGRYVRFTSTRHFPIDGGFLWALEELVVLSGNQSLAMWRPVETSSSLELFPNWSRTRSQDGQSALGLPVTTEPSPSRGFLSAVTNNPEERKWLRVDLGSEHLIDEVRLVAVESDNFQMIGEGSFPRGWTVEMSADPEFEEITWSFEMAKANLVGYPGDCAVVIPVSGRRGRYIRLVTLALWGTDWQCGYGLAEIQAYAGNENVALGKPVTASDQAGTKPGIAPAFATDGFSSHHRLVELPEYLDLIGRRGQLERERDQLTARMEGQVSTTVFLMGYGGGGVGLLAVIGWGWMLVRQRTTRRQAMALLRDQIARDLHDDIGSNLGGIVLLSEIGSKLSEDPQSRADFQTIREAADEASASMHDIVWLIQSGHFGLRDLVTKMRQSARMILGDKQVLLEVEPPDFRDCNLSLLFRRHVFFAFKETLNNIRKHAEAGKIEVTIRLDSSRFGLIIRDDGIGFNLQAAELSGHGLSNLKRRAARLNGTCHIESQPGRGSVVTFSVPLRS